MYFYLLQSAALRKKEKNTEQEKKRHRPHMYKANHYKIKAKITCQNSRINLAQKSPNRHEDKLQLLRSSLGQLSQLSVIL